MYCRTRRRSGSSIVVLGGEDTIKTRLPDDYLGHSDNQTTDLEMLTMMSVNQDNGNYNFYRTFFLLFCFYENLVFFVNWFCFYNGNPYYFDMVYLEKFNLLMRKKPTTKQKFV